MLPGTDDVDGLVALIGSDQPVIVFTPEPSRSARATMAANGFEITPVAEPLMRCTERPSASASPFLTRPGTDDVDLATAILLTSQAHQVDASLLEDTLGSAVRAGDAQIWLAFDDEEPVSAVWLRRWGASVGVMEMMTPARHQGRGAGRALLTTALAAVWTDDVDDAVLLSTPAGRRLYERVGFVAVDESLTCYRGLDDDVLDAIGQSPPEARP